jgi:hypothetical protein
VTKRSDTEARGWGPPTDSVEIRLALVLNGGVSLAVWMGGVVHEIDRLRRSTVETTVYTDIQNALGRHLIVDLIAGSSAGGINGAALGCAIAANKKLRLNGGPLRDVWLEVGNISALLRPVSEQSPKSLLRGDEYMLPAMRNAFSDLLISAPRDPSRGPPLAMPEISARVEDELEAALGIIAEERQCPTAVELFLTGSMFAGELREFEDALGIRFNVPEHRLLFRFFNDRLVTGRNDFTARPGESQEVVVERFARAARTTASFPVAFEPSDVAYQAFRPEQLTSTASRFVMDGGVLDNEPFDPILDQMALRPSGGPHRRYIAYIVPYANREQVVNAELEPNIREVAFAVANLPREVGIANGMQRMLDLSRRAGEDESARMVLLHQPAALLIALADPLLRLYQDTRTVDALSELAQSAGSRGGAGPSGGEEGTAATMAHTTDPTRDADAVSAMIPSSLEVPEDGRWPWGFAAAERIVLNILADVRQAITDADAPPTELYNRRAAVGACLVLIRRRRAAFATVTQGTRSAELSVENVHATYKVYEDDLSRIVHMAIGDDPNAGTDYLQRLLCLEVLQRAHGPELSRPIQPFWFVRMSADVANSLGIERSSEHATAGSLQEGALAPSSKLAGLTLGHFGGFLKRSWRSNDWLWGRLDGAEHLVRLLFDRLDLEPKQMTALAEVALPSGVPSEFRAELLRLAHLEHQTLEGARSLLAGDRVALQRAVTARVQLGIICREVPVLVEQTGLDISDGWRHDQPLLHLPNELTATAVREAEERDEEEPHRQFAPSLLAIFRDKWRIDEQQVGKEAGTKAFAKQATKAAAVATGALAGKRGGMPSFVGGALRWLHGVALGAYGTVRSFSASPIGGLMVAVAVATFVLLALFTSAVLAAFVVPIAVGVAAVLVAMAVGASGRGWWAACAGFIGLAVISMYVASTMVLSWKGAAVVAAVVAVLGVIVLGLSKRRRWLAYPLALVSVVVSGLALWAYADVHNNPACTTASSGDTEAQMHPAGWKQHGWMNGTDRHSEDEASANPGPSSCARNYVGDNRWLILLCFAVVLPIVIASRGLSAAAAAAAKQSEQESAAGNAQVPVVDGAAARD